MLALTSAAICPVAGPPRLPARCAQADRRTIARALPTTVFPGKPGHNKAPWTIRQDHPGGKALRQEPTMQPNTVNTHQDAEPLARAPVPPELLETVARALAAALIPPPRRPPPPEREHPADFLTAAQLTRRLSVSRETVRR